MERLPPTSFGRALRTLIRENWGTQAKFAEQVAVNNSWITKVIRGDQEGLTYSSLQRLLEGFHRRSDREELYESWRETYAPSPLDCNVPDQWSRNDQIVDYALSVHELISASKALPTFRVLTALWRHLESQTNRRRAAFEVGHALIDVANQLDRIAVSLKVSSQMKELSLASREPAWVAISLWLQSVSARHLRPRDLNRAEESFATFGKYLSDWWPASVTDRATKRGIVQCYLRDRLLVGLDILQEQKAGCEAIQGRIEALRNTVRELEEPSQIGLANEVLARALVAIGKIDEAIEPLKVAKINTSSRANQLKIQICRIQLLSADGQPQEAQATWDRAVDFTDEFHLIHHRHKLATMRPTLTAETSRSFSLPL